MLLRIGACCAAILFLAASVNAAGIPEARAAIQEATNRALAALRASDQAGYRAVLHPGFRAIDAKGRTYSNSGFVTPQLNDMDDGGKQKMRLDEASSTIRTIKMPSPGEAIVTGEEILVWMGRHGPDLVFVTPDGERAVTPNTERRTITLTYRRHWIKTGKSWRLKTSRILSENMTAVL